MSAPSVNFKPRADLQPEDILARRMRTPGVSRDLAGLFFNIDNPIEMNLVYRDIGRSGIEMDPADHARMVAARAAMSDASSLPSLADVKALPVRRKTPQEIVAEVMARPSPAPAETAYVVPTSPAPLAAAPAREQSAEVKAAIADYDARVSRHLQAVNQARSMRRKPPLTKADIPTDVMNGFMDAATSGYASAAAHGPARDAVAAARAYGRARFGR